MPGFDLGLSRDGGLTHVLDKGLGPRAWEDVLETSGAYIDIVKLGWGTAFVTAGLERKLEVLREKPVVIGGTFFEVVYATAHSVDFHDLIWEAPTKASQAWFIKHFGPEVNLGNIPPDEVIPLETLRLGLRGDTLREVLLGGDRTPTA